MSDSELKLPYEFTQDWFSNSIPNWEQLLVHFRITKALEIGSFEGRATCYLIEKIANREPLEIHCIDTWGGGIEHQSIDMLAVEQRFIKNVELAIEKVEHRVTFFSHKKNSLMALSELLVSGHNGTFDFVYVDGSHQASDVLADAILAFHLLKVGGVLIFDDYLWSIEPQGNQDAFNMPKPAIDSFVNIYQRKLQVISAPLYQLYLIKTAA